MSSIVFIISDLSIASFNTLSIFPRLCLMTFYVWGFRVWFCHPILVFSPRLITFALEVACCAGLCLSWSHHVIVQGFVFTCFCCTGPSRIGTTLSLLHQASQTMASLKVTENWLALSTMKFSLPPLQISGWRLLGSLGLLLISRLFIIYLLPWHVSLWSPIVRVACGIFTWKTLVLIFPLLQFCCWSG